MEYIDTIIIGETLTANLIFDGTIPSFDDFIKFELVYRSDVELLVLDIPKECVSVEGDKTIFSRVITAEQSEVFRGLSDKDVSVMARLTLKTGVYVVSQSYPVRIVE